MTKYPEHPDPVTLGRAKNGKIISGKRAKELHDFAFKIIELYQETYMKYAEEHFCVCNIEKILKNNQYDPLLALNEIKKLIREKHERI